MPWAIAEHQDCPGVAVINEETGRLVGCHDTEKEAKAQLAALNANVSEKAAGITIDNSAKAAAQGPWAGVNKIQLRNRLMQAVEVGRGGAVKAIRETYAIVEDDWRDNPSGALRYPHHVLQGSRLVVHIRGLQAAIQRASQFDEAGAIAHLRRHARELVAAGIIGNSKILKALTDGDLLEEHLSTADAAAHHAICGELWDRRLAHKSCEFCGDFHTRRRGDLLEVRTELGTVTLRGTGEAPLDAITKSVEDLQKSLLMPTGEHDFDAHPVFAHRCGVCGLQKDGHTSSERLIEGDHEPVIKQDAQRFSLGPWYIPDTIDGDGEWTDADELQKALWGYVRKGDRRVRLQHDTDVVAGEMLELMSWPFEVTVPMTLPTEKTKAVKEKTFPAGTVWAGVKWQPWAWNLVQKGKLRGLSIGGRAARTRADIE